MNNGTINIPLGVEMGNSAASSELATDHAGNRYDAIVANFPRQGRYHYNYSGVAWNRMYETFQDMLDKDPHLASVHETRCKAVTARNWEIVANSDTPRDREIAKCVTTIMRDIPNLEAAMKKMLNAIAFGWNVSEIIWKKNYAGKIGIKEIKSQWPGRYYTNADDQLCIKNSRWDANGTPVPDRKFIVTRFNDDNNNPYGCGLCFRAFWYWWFKKNALRFWNLYNEKYGAPLAVAKHPAGASEEIRDRLREILEALQTDTGVVLEDTQAIEFIQTAASRMGAINHYKDLAEFCNSEISKLFIGATLAVSEASNSGSFAQSRVHDKVRGEYIEDDARMIMGVINSQLVRWIVDINFGTQTPAPRFILQADDPQDLREIMEIADRAIRLGLPVSTEWMYRRLAIPQPEANAKTIRYDDQNLYQYHLQWGVLTINEVRKTLGLPPVDHGDVPSNPIVVKQLAELGLIETPTIPQNKISTIGNSNPITGSPDDKIESESTETETIEEK